MWESAKTPPIMIPSEARMPKANAYLVLVKMTQTLRVCLMIDWLSVLIAGSSTHLHGNSHCVHATLMLVGLSPNTVITQAQHCSFHKVARIDPPEEHSETLHMWTTCTSLSDRYPPVGASIRACCKSCRGWCANVLTASEQQFVLTFCCRSLFTEAKN